MAARKPDLLETVVRRYAGELRSFVQRRVGPQDAEDLLQEAYVRLLHPDPASIENPRAYLYRVTANLCADRFHREQARRRTIDAEDIDPDTLVSPSPQPDDIAEGLVQLEQLVSALDELPEACRHAFLLNRLEDLPYPEVARCLGVSPKIAQRYILKAWQHCLKRLGR